MASLWGQPSIEFGVKVVRVAGMEQPAGDQRHQLEGGTLFVRYYVPAGDGRRRLRVDTREVTCGGDGGAFWGELARFERWGPGAAGAPPPSVAGAAPAAPGGGILFELRWRPQPSSSGMAALLGTGGAGRRASRVLARAELAWRDVSSPSSSVERWLTLSPVGRELGGCKAPKLLVEVKIIQAAAIDEATAERNSGGTSECCGAGERCSQCGWVGTEEDMFLAATFSQ